MWKLPKLPKPSRRLFAFAQENRIKSNPAVEKLDEILKKEQLKGKFQREFVFGNVCIADFYNPYLGIAIEVNGGIHYSKVVKINDIKKREYYKKLEVHLIEFTDKNVLEDIKACLIEINNTIEARELAK